MSCYCCGNWVQCFYCFLVLTDIMLSFVVTESMNIYEDFINAKKEKKENIPFSPKYYLSRLNGNLGAEKFSHSLKNCFAFNRKVFCNFVLNRLRKLLRSSLCQSM